MVIGNSIGKWISLGKFYVDSDYEQIHFSFDTPVTFSSIGATRLSRSECNHLFGYWLTDVQVYID